MSEPYVPMVGAAGPRTIRESNPETEIKNPKRAAWITFWGGELIVLILEAVALLFPEFAFALLAVGIAAGAAVLARRVVRIERTTGATERISPLEALLVFAGLCGFAVPLALAAARAALASLGAGAALLGRFAAELWAALQIPWYGMVVVAILWLFLAVRGKRIRQFATGLVAIGFVVACGFQLKYFYAWWLLGQAWTILRWLALPYFVPPLVAAAVLNLAMIKEILLPAFEHTLQPIPWAEFVQAGGRLWHLFFPKRQKEEEEESPPEPHLRVTITAQEHGPEDPDMRDFDLPLPRIPERDGLPGYALALLQGKAAFSWEGNRSQWGARHFGYTQPQFKEALRPAVIGAKLAKDRGNAGVQWRDAGYCTLVQHAADEYGAGVIPREYWKYLYPSQRPEKEPEETEEEPSPDSESVGLSVGCLSPDENDDNEPEISGGVVAAVRGNGDHDVKAN